MSLENVPYCDIFYPTYEEFQNFENYVESCEKNAKSAIIKVNNLNYKFLIRLFRQNTGKQEKMIISI